MNATIPGFWVTSAEFDERLYDETFRPILQEFIRNYGGVTCFSCRAFWRRAHLNSKVTEFVCKKGASCRITVKNRKKCKQCRYERCKLTGMTEEAILDDDRKKQRFRKMLEKRKRMPEDPTSVYPSIFSTRPARKKPKLEVTESIPDASPERAAAAGVETGNRGTCIVPVSTETLLNISRFISLNLRVKLSLRVRLPWLCNRRQVRRANLP